MKASNTTMYPHITPDSWVEPLQELSASRHTNGGAPDSDEDDDDEDAEPLVALVKGPKRSGKSTFARAALNNLLSRYTKIAWLECDLGQGEFSPGGAVGLWVLDQPILGTCHDSYSIYLLDSSAANGGLGSRRQAHLSHILGYPNERIISDRSLRKHVPTSTSPRFTSSSHIGNTKSPTLSSPLLPPFPQVRQRAERSHQSSR